MTLTKAATRKTGKKIKVKPKKLPFFKVGKDLREQVNGNRKK